MVGMHGSYAANIAMTEADLVIGIGVRFDDRVTGKLDVFAPKAKIAHFEVDPAEIGKNVPVDYQVKGWAGVCRALPTVWRLRSLPLPRFTVDGWLR